ncbi:MAG: ATP-binding cassette domain-containing protein [Rubrobacteraceae bacterium]
MLELKGLKKRYGDTVALDGLSFTVGEGQMFGFVGPNGAGKTTAMRILLGVLEPDEGEVLWRDSPIDAATRRRFGYMPEERGLYPKMRVGEQLSYLARLHGFSKGDADEAAERWTKRLGIHGRAGDKTENLSLGNQQRVQLAAALVHDPDLLVLDEPFSGLDPVGVDTLSEVLLERVEAGVPVVFSSHQLELVERLCEAVAIVRDGRLVAEGTVEELRAPRGRRLLQVNVQNGDGRWTEDLRGVSAVEHKGREGVLLSLDEDADEQEVLAAAQNAGRVTHFGFARRSLNELFREVMEG